MSIKRITRRQFLQSATAGAGILVLSACGTAVPVVETQPAQPAAENPPTAAPAPATTEPQASGVLKVVTNDKPDVVNPWLRTESNLSWYPTVYDTLTRYDEKVQPQPHLAESWEWSDNSTKLTMHLRKGVKFHTGRESTAEDVEWNIRQIQDPEIGSQLRGSAEAIVDIQRPDTHTIVFSFEQPTLNFFDMLEAFNIADPESADEILGGRAEVGTGPFVLKEMDVDTGFIFERNPDYWMPGKPHLAGLELAIVPDKNAMVLNLESGAANLAIAPNPQAVKRLMEDDRFTVMLSDNEAPRYIVGFNTKAPVLEDKRVRQALNWAIPRQRFAETALLGLVQPASLPWAKVSPAYDSELSQAVTYNLDKARSLLQEAGVDPSSMQLKLTYIAENEDFKAFAVMYQKELSDLGFTVEIDPVPGANFVKLLKGQEIEQIYISQHNNHMLFPTSLLTQNFPYRAGNNGSQFENAEYERLVAEASLETDEAKRQELLNQINQLMLNEAFVCPFGNRAFAWVMSNNVEGLGYSKFNWMQYENVRFTT